MDEENDKKTEEKEGKIKNEKIIEENEVNEERNKEKNKDGLKGGIKELDEKKNEIKNKEEDILKKSNEEDKEQNGE